MFNVKTLSAITLAITTCAIASSASAQSSPQILDKAQPILSQPAFPVKSITAERLVEPTETRKIKRVVKRPPAQATATQPQQKNIYGQKINANTSEKTAPTRFIYSQRKDDTPIPVYFSEEANKSK